MDIELELTIAKKYVALKESAEKRGKEFNMSLQSLRNIYTATKCYYSGVTLTREPGHHNSMTIDRVDNSKGYVTGNVVACSKRMNNIKGDMSYSEIEVLFKKLSKRKA